MRMHPFDLSSVACTVLHMYPKSSELLALKSEQRLLKNKATKNPNQTVENSCSDACISQVFKTSQVSKYVVVSQPIVRLRESMLILFDSV